MAPFFFHQNMLSFGGGTPNRNVAYASAFARIHNETGWGQIAVAGFTEIMNGNSSVAPLQTCSNALFGEVGAQLYVVPCGVTALTSWNPEFIAIAVRAQYKVSCLGRISFDASGSALHLIHERKQDPTPGSVNWVLPAGASPDFRGLVYVVASMGSRNIAVGFLHNLYTFECHKILVRARIGEMLGRMADAPRDSYIGGDFNLPPCDVPILHSDRAFAHSGLDAQWNPIPTTAWGNVYDYWYARIPRGARLPTPLVSLTTLGGPGLSDHAAIGLRTP